MNGALFEIVVGERRVRAAKSAGIDRAPGYGMRYDDSDTLAIQLVENLQRDDLTPIEEANGYHEALHLCDAKGNKIFTLESLAKRTGKSERTIRERLPLVDLPEEAKREVEAGVLRRYSAAHRQSAGRKNATRCDAPNSASDDKRKSKLRRSFGNGAAECACGDGCHSQ
jgi:ParB/RepB/Spo0J family partition protein